jgi:protein-L-isoaspartate O-methyltransferase
MEIKKLDIHALPSDVINSQVMNAFMDLERQLGFAAISANKNRVFQFQDKKTEAGEYPFIPLYANRFIEQLNAAKQIMRKEFAPKPLISFIDVGCGIGTKVLLAQRCLGQFSANFFGIEISKQYLTMAKKLVPGGKFICADAIKHDYSPYDIIYFYCPLSNYKLQMKLERRIMTTAHKGALVLPNLRKCNDDEWNPHITARYEQGIMVI